MPQVLLLQSKGGMPMAATRLIPMHVNKGKTLAQSLGDRTDYAKNPEENEPGPIGYRLSVRSDDGRGRVSAVQAPI